MNLDLTGKRILITSGTSVLGCAFIRRAVQEGAAVFFTHHTNDKVARELKELGARGFQANLSKTSEIDRLETEVKSFTSTLGGLIHNAALVRIGQFKT